MTAEPADFEPFGPVDGEVRHAELRFRRIATFAIGVSIGGYLIADFATIRAQVVQFGTIWCVFAIGGQALGALAFLVLPWFAGERALRAAAISFACFGLLILAFAVPAVLHPPITGGVAWPLLVKTDYALAAVLGLPPLAAWCFIGAIEVLAAFVDWALTAQTDPFRVAENLITSLSVAALLAFVVHIVLRAGREIDLAEAGAVRALRYAAAESARASERRRIELLTHDAVLSTLRAASLGLDSATTSLQSLARVALEQLQPHDDDEQVIGGEEFAARLCAHVARLSPDAQVTTVIDPEAALPAEVVSALLDASGEGLRNSIAHAGEPVDRRVAVQVDASQVTVVLSDTGVGFAPELVPPGRLGIARSIIERMQATAGGSASIASRPGAGTTVTLRWQR